MDTILETLGKIGFDWQVAIANLVNFIIIVFILQRFAWKPLQRVIGERQKLIASGISKAKDADHLKNEASKESAALILEAKRKASHIVADASKSGADIISSAQKTAKEDRDHLLAQAALEAERLKYDALQHAERDVETLVRETTRTLIKNMPDELHERIIREKLA